MKTLTLILAFFCINTIQAQYTIDLVNAPKNPLPMRYTRAHFGLKGNVEEYRSNTRSGYFNANGNLTSDFEGNFYDYINFEYTYNDKGHLIKQTYDHPTFPSEYTIVTDSKGRIIEISNTKGYLRAFTYDSKGLLIEEKDGAINKTIHTYDASGRIISSKSSIQEITYTYQSTSGILKVEIKKVYQNDIANATITTQYYNDKGFEVYGLTGKYLNTYDEQGNVLNGVSYGLPIVQTYKYFNKAEKSIEESTIPSSTDPFGGKCISGNCIEGWGKLTYVDGSYYEGFWSKGFRNGYGTFSSASFMYAGEWKNHNINGIGYAKTETENLFGTFKNAQLDGSAYRISKDKMEIGVFQNGKCLVPNEFKNNNLTQGCVMGDCENKFGRFIYEGGDMYEGFFYNNSWVLGELRRPERFIYQGQFKQGVFDGFGRYQGADGMQYAGYWKNGKYNGLGYYQESNGKNTKIGLWENGVLVKAM